MATTTPWIIAIRTLRFCVSSSNFMIGNSQLCGVRPSIFSSSKAAARNASAAGEVSAAQPRRLVEEGVEREGYDGSGDRRPDDSVREGLGDGAAEGRARRLAEQLVQDEVDHRVEGRRAREDGYAQQRVVYHQ